MLNCKLYRRSGGFYTVLQVLPPREQALQCWNSRCESPAVTAHNVHHSRSFSPSAHALNMPTAPLNRSIGGDNKNAKLRTLRSKPLGWGSPSRGLRPGPTLVSSFRAWTSGDVQKNMCLTDCEYAAGQSYQLTPFTISVACDIRLPPQPPHTSGTCVPVLS